METTRDNGRGGKPHLERLKLESAKLILERFSLEGIRGKSIANLLRWKTQGTWCSAYGEWLELMTTGSDVDVISAMAGENEDATRLRASMPYVGLLDQETVWALKKQWVGFDIDKYPDLKDLDLTRL